MSTYSHYQALIKGLIGHDITLWTRRNDKMDWHEVGSRISDDINKSDITWNFELGEYEVRCRDLAVQVSRWDTTVRTMVPTFNHVIASWKLYQLQHCCAIAVSCNAFVRTDLRGKGLGRLLNTLRQDISRGLGYSLLMCTDVVTNEAQRKVLASNNWKEIYQVLNRRTKSTVAISVINL